jgi:hypothetical protein
MIRVMFDCPTTGEPLRTTVRFGRWPAEQSLLNVHCFKCGTTHSFRREDAIDGDARRALSHG